MSVGVREQGREGCRSCAAVCEGGPVEFAICIDLFLSQEDLKLEGKGYAYLLRAFTYGRTDYACATCHPFLPSMRDIELFQLLAALTSKYV